MYLWHYLCLYQVLKITEQMGEGWVSWALRGVLSLLFTYLLAMISWMFLEAPMNKFKRQFERASGAALPVVTDVNAA